MKTKILIVGDTHISSFKDLPNKILQYVKDSNLVIHVGDYTSKNIVEVKEFRDQNVNVIAYGLTHDAKIQWVDKTLLVNPGKGYIDEFSYSPSASIAIITRGKDIKAEIIFCSM